MEAATVQKPVILEVNLISAQALPHESNIRFLSSSNMETYVVAYVNPSQKLRSRTDKNGDVNPTWNDKFIFVLDEGLLTRSSSSCLIFKIYCRRRFKKDKRIGEVHVLLENLIKNHPFCHDGEIRNYAAAFHVRDPYGEPHGVLNIGTATLNDIFHDQVPKFLSSNCAVDHRTLMTPPRLGMSTKSCNFSRRIQHARCPRRTYLEIGTMYKLAMANAMRSGYHSVRTLNLEEQERISVPGFFSSD